MEQDFKSLSDKFNNRYYILFQIENNKTIEKSMYALGVLLSSSHLPNKNIRPYNPKDFELVNEWDIDIWLRVIWGKDDIERNIEEDTIIMDKALAQIPYYDHLVSNAVKYNRPAWSIFGLIGMMQGRLNQNEFEVISKEYVFTKEDFIRCVKYLPSCFLKQYKDDLGFLFSYFDERNYKIMISDFGEISTV